MPTPEEREIQPKIRIDLLEACLDHRIRVVLLPDGDFFFETELDRERFDKFKAEFEATENARLANFTRSLDALHDKIAQVTSASVNSPMRSNTAPYLIVSVNDDGEHEIIYVTGEWADLMRRWRAFAGNGAIYKIHKEE